jgi:phosphatidate cytidylyltransferase
MAKGKPSSPSGARPGRRPDGAGEARGAAAGPAGDGRPAGFVDMTGSLGRDDAAAPEAAPAVPAGPSNLKLRVLSALVMVPAVLVATAFGGYAFAALIGIVSALVLLEWQSMVRHRAPSGVAITAAVLIGGAIIGGPTGASTVTLGMIMLALMLAALVDGHAEEPAVRNWLYYGPIYAAVPGLALVALRGDDKIGLMAILFLFAVVWSTDIAAYFTGRALGGPKLWPSVSPNKTWSGALGGLVAAMLAGSLVGLYAGVPRLGPLFFVAAALSVASQLGDLFESGLKRRFGAKDSGHIIPGHGGVMDRVDGLVAAAVIAFMIGTLRNGQGVPAAGLLSW